MNKAARIAKLNELLNSYAHRWGENPSARMIAWVDEYNGLARDRSPEWVAFCESKNFVVDHDAGDVLA